MTDRSGGGAANSDVLRILRRALADLEAQSAVIWSGQDGRAAPHPTVVRLAPEGRRAPPPPPRFPERAKWAGGMLSPEAGHTGLFAYPGHLSASLQAQNYMALGYVLGNDNPERIELAVETVSRVQRQRKSFTPVFITSSTHVAPFLRHGYIFEYVPPRERFGGTDEDYEAWRTRRLAFIAAKWQLTSVTDYREDVAADASITRKPQLVFFPDYRANNPYLDMMYAGVGENIEVSAGGINDAIALARDHRTIFHLHWEDAVFRDAPAEEAPVVMAEFIRAIDVLKSRGGRFVWTVHNIDPHDASDIELARAFSGQLLLRADVVHVHDEVAAGRLNGRTGTSARLAIIAHPSYETADPIPRTVARDRLGLGDDEIVFLTLGNIRRYKGIESLLHVASETVPGARFVIAGRSSNYDPRGALPANCIALNGHQSAEDVAALHAAADFALLPFEHITTSGSLMLALSHGVPVIAPDIAAISRDIRDGLEGYLYAIDGIGGLAAAVARAMSTPTWQREAMSQSARAAAGHRPPDAFAAQCAALFDELLQEEQPRESHDQ